MNKLRRKYINKIIERIRLASNNTSIDELKDIAGEIEIIQNEEEDYRDNIPENMYGGSKYEAADEACDNLSYAYDCIDEAMDVEDKDYYLKKAIEYLNDASV